MDGKGNVVLDFVDDDLDGVAEGSELAKRYVWGQRVDELFAQENVDDLVNADPEDIDWTLTDNLGTVRDLAIYDDVADATSVTEHFTYEAFGRITSGDPSVIRYTYTAQELDPDTALFYMDGRWYRPSTGRFTTPDPIEDDQENTYRYVNNGPTMNTDPTGLEKYLMPGHPEASWNPLEVVPFWFRHSPSEHLRGLYTTNTDVKPWTDTGLSAAGESYANNPARDKLGYIPHPLATATDAALGSVESASVNEHAQNAQLAAAKARAIADAITASDNVWEGIHNAFRDEVIPGVLQQLAVGFKEAGIIDGGGNLNQQKIADMAKGAIGNKAAQNLVRWAAEADIKISVGGQRRHKIPFDPISRIATHDWVTSVGAGVKMNLDSGKFFPHAFAAGRYAIKIDVPKTATLVKFVPQVGFKAEAGIELSPGKEPTVKVKVIGSVALEGRIEYGLTDDWKAFLGFGPSGSLGWENEIPLKDFVKGNFNAAGKGEFKDGFAMYARLVMDTKPGLLLGKDNYSERATLLKLTYGSENAVF